MTTADTLYGRRGGGWLPKPPPARPAPTPSRAATCLVCGATFQHRNAGDPPPVCGMPHCRAVHEWGDDEWAGATRMATARRDTGIPLNDLDRHALNRGTG